MHAGRADERTDYELVDFGGGRKLERFGPVLLDRPSPAAEGATRREPELWRQAAAIYTRSAEGAAQRGSWEHRRPIEQPWPIAFGPLTFELKLTEFGHLGLFPEQRDNWRWISEQICSAGRPLKVLNLFAYTGGSTLAAASAGAEVVHVDAAANVMAWARRNAEASKLADAPIRWITEDARRFVTRELKRGNRYDAVILDPPGYGHGPKGEAWKLDEHLAELLAMCRELTAARRDFLLVTCHSGELALAPRLRAFTIGECPELANSGRIACDEMWLQARAGARLHSGAAFRWAAEK